MDSGGPRAFKRQVPPRNKIYCSLSHEASESPDDSSSIRFENQTAPCRLGWGLPLALLMYSADSEVFPQIRYLKERCCVNVGSSQSEAIRQLLSSCVS